jgi:two-component system chemotaxis response regulator CheY
MGAKVLIVDDALFMRNMLRNIFSESGFDIVGEAQNGNEAIEMYQRLKPDLVTMDIVMPEKNGIEALKEIMAADGTARIVICSALGQESLIMEALEAGARDFIVKPFKPPKVIEVAQKVLSSD